MCQPEATRATDLSDSIQRPVTSPECFPVFPQELLERKDHIEGGGGSYRWRVVASVSPYVVRAGF